MTSLGAGLAVPDWPTTFGYNMFLYPWSKMVGGIFYEHSHRLVASAVGFLTIALALRYGYRSAANGCAGWASGRSCWSSCKASLAAFGWSC